MDASTGSCGLDHCDAIALLDGHIHVLLRVALERPCALGFAGHDLQRDRLPSPGVDRHVVVVDLHDREAGERHADVHDQDHDDDVVDGAWYVSPRIGRLFGHVRDRLDARVRDGADGEAIQEIAPGRRYTPDDLVDQQTRREQQHQRDDHDEDLCREVEQREDDVEACGLFDADDIDDHEQDGGDDAADGVVRPLEEDRPEDGQVVRHEEGRDGDGRRVDEHLAPADAEAHELVEGAAGEAGCATRLGHGRSRLGVRPSRGHEQQCR